MRHDSQLAVTNAVGAVADVTTFITIPIAVVCALIAVTLRLVRGPWDDAPAAIREGNVRWMTADGSFHSSPAAAEFAAGGSADTLRVHYRTRRPNVCYPHRVAHDERVLQVVAGCLAIVAVIALAVSTIAMLL